MITPRRPRQLDLPNLSVLVIDDQPFFRTLLVEVMRTLGVSDISVAVDGATGLTAFEEHRPDVVITDWAMPNIDGVALTKRIRSHPVETRRQTPIIMVTANSQRSKIEFARSCGIDEFILKPISAKAILERLREIIERPRPFVTNSTNTGPCRRRRADPAFLGPYRRYDDPMEVDDGVQVLEEGMVSVMRKALDHVKNLAAGLAKGTPNVRPLHMAVIEIQGMAEDMDDSHLEQACDLFLSYIVVMNATRKVVPVIVQSYIEALGTLLSTPTSDQRQRDDIINGLNRLVRRPNAA